MTHEHTDNFRLDDERLLHHVRFARGLSDALAGLFRSDQGSAEETAEFGQGESESK